MVFVELPHDGGLLYVPDRRPGRRKHPCPDCHACQLCSDDRCDLCRSRESALVDAGSKDECRKKGGGMTEAASRRSPPFNENWAQRLAEIRNDRDRGASELASRALRYLAEHANRAGSGDGPALREELLTLADRLRASRPSMAPLWNLLTRFQHELVGLPTTDLGLYQEQAAALAMDLSRRSMAAAGTAARHAADLIAPGDTVFTHSLSSTVLAAFRLLAGKPVRAIITESRPLCEGRRLAEELSRLGIPARYVTEAQIGIFVREAALVLVGADSFLPDGAVVNKAGTYPLALAARDQGVPFYAAAESFKTLPPDRPPVLERMDPAELGFAPPPGVILENTSFDTTPARLISGWITEQGIFRQWPAG